MRRKRISVRRERIFGRRLREAERRHRPLVGHEPEDRAEWQTGADTNAGCELGGRAVQSAGECAEGIVDSGASDFLFARRQFVIEDSF